MSQQDHGLSYDEIFRALESGAEAASRRLGIDITLTPGISRERGPELGLEVAAASVANLDRGVTGFDLFGQEAHHPPELFEAAFRLAKDAGLGITVHAGEAAGPESVIAAVRVLGASRISHGVRAAESDEAVHLLSAEGVFVETCPTSNLQTRAVPALSAHPLLALLAAGVRCGVFTDDPWVCGTTLSREYERAVSEIGVSARPGPGLRPGRRGGRLRPSGDEAAAAAPAHQLGGVMIQIARTVPGPGFRYQCGTVLR